MKVGFIGLGNMGGPMAMNVARAGFEMTVLDLVQERMRPLLEMGASGAGSAAEVAATSDVTFTSLPGPPEMEAVATREGWGAGGDRGGVSVRGPDGRTGLRWCVGLSRCSGRRGARCWMRR